jgi:hypothetical protein
VALVVVVEHVEDVLAEFIGLALRKEHFVHVDELLLV